MSSVWVTIPSARPPEVVAEWAKAWRERGYKIALWRDEAMHTGFDDAIDIVKFGGAAPYPGYANAVNNLVSMVAEHVPDSEWFIIGGDDVFPDPDHSAEEIAQQCREYFETVRVVRHFDDVGENYDKGSATFGVM